MSPQLNILMLTHKTKVASWPRSHAFAKQLVNSGHQVTLLLISENKRSGFNHYQWDGIRVVESPDLLWGRLRSGWDLWNTLTRLFWVNKDQTKFDLIHCFETRPASIYPALFASRKHGIPIITDWNDWWGRHGLIDVNRPLWYRYLVGWLETYYEEAFRMKAAGLTVIAKGLENRAIAMGIPADHICLLPGGASIDTFKVMDKFACRQQVHLEGDSPILGFCSADSYLDIEMVLDALKLLVNRYPTIKLIMTGKVKSNVLEMIHQRQLENHLVLPGFLSTEDYAIYLSCADVFLLPLADKPYNLGRWPNKMCDYLSLGRPTVSNPVGDIQTLFESYPVGLLASWDVEDFARQVSILIDRPELAQEYGEKSRWVAENVYNWEALGNRLEQFYFRTLNQNPLDTQTIPDLYLNIHPKER